MGVSCGDRMLKMTSNKKTVKISMKEKIIIFGEKKTHPRYVALSNTSF